MSKFKYTSTSKTGAISTGTVEADSRGDAIARVKQLGLNPISVTEIAAKRPGKFGPAIRVALLCAALAVVIFAAVKLSAKARGELAAKEAQKTEFTAVPAILPGKIDEAVAPAAAKDDTGKLAEDASAGDDGKTAPALASGKDAKGSKADKPKKERVYLNPPKEGDENKPRFKVASETEALLGMLLSTPPGMAPLPLPMTDAEIDAAFEADADKALAHTIEIGENDDEKMADHKINVAWAKEDLAEYIKQGGNAKDYVRELYRYKKEGAEGRRDLVKYFREVVDAGESSYEDLKAELDNANAALKENDQPEISLKEIGLAEED